MHQRFSHRPSRPSGQSTEPWARRKVARLFQPGIERDRRYTTNRVTDHPYLRPSAAHRVAHSSLLNGFRSELSDGRLCDVFRRQDQGDLVGKQEVQTRFLMKLNRARQDRSFFESANWSGLRAIFSVVFKDFHSLDGEMLSAQ
jgi:hypothetical protein